MCKRYLEEAR